MSEQQSDDGSLAPVRRLAQFWNWLPVFRAVAESEHLPTAARELATSAPGLSRTVRQLEEALEQPLFDRGNARSLALNQRGRVFLQYVRDAMRRIDDGLQAIHEMTFRGPVRIVASHSVAMTYLLPALERLAERCPELRPEILTMDDQDACIALRKGSIDLALIEQGEVPDDLTVSWLESSSYSIYCGADHPLVRSPPKTLEDCLPYGFVAPPAGITDGWPANLRRQVHLRVSALSMGAKVCASGRLLAVLPDDFAIDAGGKCGACRYRR